MSMTSYAAAALALGSLLGRAQADNVEKKNVTVIAAESSADGRSEVRREMVKDCIEALPNPEKLEPQITSETVFLREINGETGRNEWVKTYTAHLDLNYLNYQKEILIITTRSVQGQEPVMKDVEKKLKRTESFVSDPSEGETYAGRSHRQYYFAKAEDAVKDVKKRARIWIQQQAAVVCTEK